MVELTEKQRETIKALHKSPSTIYSVALSLFGERYGIYASRAQGRLQTLKRLGLATNDGGFWRLTRSGRAALSEGDRA